MDTDKREILQNGILRMVTPKVFDLLVHLIESRDRVVSRDELVEMIWHGTIPSDNAITQTVKQARAALNDSDAIRTVHRIGYRFIRELNASKIETGHNNEKTRGQA